MSVCLSCERLVDFLARLRGAPAACSACGVDKRAAVIDLQINYQLRKTGPFTKRSNTTPPYF